MLKRAEKKEFRRSYMDKREVLSEILFDASAAIEHAALDANLLMHDIAVDIREILVNAIRTNERYRRAFYSFYYSMRRYPRVSAVLYSLVVMR